MNPKPISEWMPRSMEWINGRSPIEVQMKNYLNDMLRPDVLVDAEVEVMTRIGMFRVDFILYSLRQREVIAIECDGAEYHDTYRDECRDAFILSRGIINFIYRFSGSELYRFREWNLGHIAQGHPHLFTMAALAKLNSSFNASSEIYEKPVHIDYPHLSRRARTGRFGGHILEMAQQKNIFDIDALTEILVQEYEKSQAQIDEDMMKFFDR